MMLDLDPRYTLKKGGGSYPAPRHQPRSLNLQETLVYFVNLFGRSCHSTGRSVATETLGAVAPRGCCFRFALCLAFFSRIQNILALSGSICSQHAFIRIDTEQARFVVSSTSVSQHALPETVLVRSSVAHRSTSRLDVVPTCAGLYSCCFPMDIGHLIGADVCLGCN